MSYRNRLAGELDAVLHLMDRQVVDIDGRMVCKVDDVELVETEHGLTVSGLLVGATALVPRFGGRLGEATLRQWCRLGAEQADRTTPYRIGLEEVERLGSAVELRRTGEGVLARQRPSGPTHRRLNELMQMRVYAAHGAELGNVIDVRLVPRGEPEEHGRVLVSGLIVGRGRPGSFLGYDRGPDQGPWLVNRVVRWLHRHSGLVAMDEVARIDWETDRITLARPDLDDLPPAGG